MKEKKDKDITCKGIGVSPGIAVGKAFLFFSERMEVPAFCHLDKTLLQREVDRFKDAVDTSKAQLQRIRDGLLQNRKGKGKEHVRIIDAHIMMLDDEMLINDTIKTIKRERVNAEWALNKVLQSIKEFFNVIEDEYLRERGSDIEYIGDRILNNLLGEERDSMSEIDEEVIIVARYLAPTDTAQIPGSKVKGFLTDMGGRTSHTAIFARSIEIPSVVGLENITQLVKNGDTLIMDGNSGMVIINPSREVFREYEKIKEQFSSYEKSLHYYSKLPAETVDGRRIKLMGNIEFLGEVSELLDRGAEGIGLYRTEFLYLNRKDLPSEDEHFDVYKKVVKKVKDYPTVIRTLDLGGDKLLPNMGLADEANPALGLRAIRLCLRRTDIFKVQLKGILRASVFGNLKIMFPLISGVKELRIAKEIVKDAKKELRKEGKAFNDEIEIGIMIEVPSAAFIADILAKEADFFSIGTNDLLQYCLAIDRGNDHVDYLYDPLHPAILRIIKSIVKSAHDAGIEVGICGEMAGEPEYVMILLALGLDQLSMNALSLLKVKKAIRALNYSELLKISDEILLMPTAFDVKNFIEKYEEKRFKNTPV